MNDGIQLFMKQLQLTGQLNSQDLKKIKSGYGGELLKKAAARKRGRPLATKAPMHLVLRSSLAKRHWSFQNPRNARKVSELVRRFSKKYGVRVLHGANVGNHLHLMIRLSNRHSYAPFIRALTGAIAMQVTDTNKWRLHGRSRSQGRERSARLSDRERSAKIFARTDKTTGDPPEMNSQKKLKFWDYRPFTRVLEGGRRECFVVADYILINRIEGSGMPRSHAEILVKGPPGDTG